MPLAMIDGRTTLATIVQSSTVELFQIYGIAIAPITSLKSLPAGLELQLSATATLASPVLSGNLAVFVPVEVATNAKHPTPRPYEPRDWMREMCNQLVGRVKNRLHGCDVNLRTGLPMSVTGGLLDRHRSGNPPEAIYGFRTLRSQITVTLTGSINYSRILYTGSPCAAKEGDVILF